MNRFSIVRRKPLFAAMTMNKAEGERALHYVETAEFQRDFKRLKKRFRTLDDDFSMMKRAAIELFHVHGVDNGACIEIEGFCPHPRFSYKVVKFACKSLKNKGVRSGLRAIYVFDSETRTVHFVEIYYHEKDGTDLDRNRLKTFLA